MSQQHNPDANMLIVEDAQRIVLEHCVRTPIEHVAVWDAVGRPLCEDVTTDIDLAPFANSAMDGYAVRSADLEQASEDSPVELSVIGHEAAGHVFDGTIEPGTTIRIMTGAPVPLGADAVVKYEDVEVISGDGNEDSRVMFHETAACGSNIREAGLEAKRGDVVMRTGEVVTPAGAGLLANAGAATVAVHRAPRVGIISLGTELVGADCVPQRGQIRDVNAPALIASAKAAGAHATFFGIVPDDEEQIRSTIIKAAQECDVVVTSGGASAGDYDYVRALIEREGELLFDRVAMRPGKAVTFGLMEDTLFFGLSGNPAGAYVGFELFVRPALRAMMGHALLARPFQKAHLVEDLKKRQERRFYNRAAVARDEETGELFVSQAPTQNSALLVDLHKGNALIVTSDTKESLQPGDMVDVLRYDIDEGVVL